MVVLLTGRAGGARPVVQGSQARGAVWFAVVRVRPREGTAARTTATTGLPDTSIVASGAVAILDHDPSAVPSLQDLPAAVAAARPFLARARAQRGARYVNHEGGDVEGNGSTASLVRHVANYLVAVRVAGGPPTRLVDVGSGVGALGAWLADRLGGVPLHLVDHSAALRRIAAAAFPDAEVHADTAGLEPEPDSLVTAMEVIEHIAPAGQHDFVASLWRLVGSGGALVLSTPDESGFRGGWSGYAPHIGPLDAAGLRRVVGEATGAPVTVWRLYGAPYRVGPWRRVLQPPLNRAWGAVSGSLPAAATRLAALASPLVARLARALRRGERPAPAVVARAAGPDEAPSANVDGNGLIAVVRRP